MNSSIIQVLLFAAISTLGIIAFVWVFAKALDKLNELNEPYEPRATIDGVRAVRVQNEDGSRFELPPTAVPELTKASAVLLILVGLWLFVALRFSQFSSFVYALFYLVAFVGVRRYSRVAAIAAVILTVVGSGAQVIGGNYYLAVAFLSFLYPLLAATGGIFRYHRARKEMHQASSA